MTHNHGKMEITTENLVEIGAEIAAFWEQFIDAAQQAASVDALQKLAWEASSRSTAVWYALKLEQDRIEGKPCEKCGRKPEEQEVSNGSH